MKKFLWIFLLVPQLLDAQIHVSFQKNDQQRFFEVVGERSTAVIVFDPSENALVHKSAHFLAEDIERVTGKKVAVKALGLVKDFDGIDSVDVIIVGTIDNSSILKELISSGKLTVDELQGQWERHRIQTIEQPFPGVNKALVIAGSDRRGAAYGVFTISEKIGVSPWYWWADVPVAKHAEVYIEDCNFLSKSPAVKYRGIFINDEAPAFTNWAFEKFGGINHKVYEKVFELLLRNKANFLWPSMWLPTMFYVDDPLNAKTADDFGIVMSTSHHEPMTRAHQEWEEFGEGPWNYVTNGEKLREFWKGGIERIGSYETMVTVGMRGDGDDAMSEETAVDLLETIIRDQRKILEEVTQKPANETPQVWAIYKEVQDYYDKGMRVPDDVTILLSDDNWGNIRYLPMQNSENKGVKYGMYYHFDYVGAPTSYRWQNVTQIERVWEQMKLTYEHGVNEIWIVNVGDIKPMEFPISFFLDLAWDPDAIQAEDLPSYYIHWSKQQFGGHFSEDIAKLLALYTKYNSRRTPEMLTSDTYSIENYREADRIIAEFNELLRRSTAIYQQIPLHYRDAFYQLVHSPIEMCANLNEMYVSAGKNKYYGVRGAVAANYYADRTKELFEKDAALKKEFHSMNDGKWNHMMSQTYIGYTGWNHPPLNMMPAVSYVQVPESDEIGYLIEHGVPPRWGWLGVEGRWGFSRNMPVFDPINDQSYYLDIINRGAREIGYSLKGKQDWIKVSSDRGSVLFHEKVYVSIDWERAPAGRATGELILSGAGKKYSVQVPINNIQVEATGFIENEGVVAIEPANFSRKVDGGRAHWTLVPNLGRTDASLIVEPMNSEKQVSVEKAPLVVYDFTTFSSGDIRVHVYVSPTQDFKREVGLQFALAIDDGEPQIININEGETVPDYKYASWWMRSVGDNVKIKTSKHYLKSPGVHTLKVWGLDSGLVIQKIVIDTGGKKPSYLGPPESTFKQ
ncbi:MAG: glycosyl hydrolase 115 family protein [Mongoliitalea sp.]